MDSDHQKKFDRLRGGPPHRNGEPWHNKEDDQLLDGILRGDCYFSPKDQKHSLWHNHQRNHRSLKRRWERLAKRDQQACDYVPTIREQRAGGFTPQDYQTIAWATHQDGVECCANDLGWLMRVLNRTKPELLDVLSKLVARGTGLMSAPTELSSEWWGLVHTQTNKLARGIDWGIAWRTP